MRLSPLLLASLLAFPAALMAATPQDTTPAGVAPADWQGIKAAYEKSRHAIQAETGGHHVARNAGQEWITKFDGRGFTVTPDAGGWTWGLELAGAAGQAPEKRVEGTKLSYVWNESLTEWFINDQRGLEQGWTFSAKPEDQSGCLRLELSFRGGLQAEVSEDARSVVFRDKQGQSVLNYGGLKAWDADAKILPVRFIAAGQTLVVTLDDHSARYPVTIDPVAQLAYFKASNTDAGDNFGNAVAISGDTIVVGAPFEDSNASASNGDQSNNSFPDAGAAYVFVRSGGTWTQQAYLKAFNRASNDWFGTAVAISGNTLVVGAPGEDVNATGINGDTSIRNLAESGAAYIFKRVGNEWFHDAYLKPGNLGLMSFGISVAASGNTVLVGAGAEDSDGKGVNPVFPGPALNAGAAYVFVKNGASWSQQAYLKASNTDSDDRFGESVALSGDLAAIGAPNERSNATGINGDQADNSAGLSGAVYVFSRDGSTWSQEAYVKASNTGNTDIFGKRVALAGNRLIVGAPGEDSSSAGVNGAQADNSLPESGAAYIFSRSNGVWTQEAYLKASNPGLNDNFGWSVGLSQGVAVVGAHGEASTATGVNGDQSLNILLNVGAAYMFTHTGNAWVQRAYLKPPVAGQHLFFGYALALDGRNAVIGALGDASGATGVNGNPEGEVMSFSGAAHLFDVAATYLLTASGEHGTVNGGGEYSEDTNAILSATPETGYVFTGWSGDASGSSNPLSVAMNGDKTIIANFSPDTSDADGDGLSGYLEGIVYHTNPTLADTDGDGLSDAWEVGRGRYSIIEGSFTWAQARADAKSRGGDLASFPTEERWNRAMETLGVDPFDNYTGLWIGASDAGTEGVWTWVNGETFTYSRWGTSRPTSSAGNTLDFAEISGGAGAEIGKWYDRSSATVREGYLLEAGYATDPTVADADGDGLTDGAEQAAGSSPFLSDTDGDGLTDPQEINLTHTNPKLADSDNDGTSDAAEDLDTDGLSNLAEISQHGTHPLLADTDGDGLSDGMEANYPGSYYKTVTGGFSYPQAAADAAMKHGRVAAFPNSEEYTRVAAEARKTTQAHLWIGLSDAVEGTWVWTDGSIANYTRWLAGQPDGGATENQVVIMQGGVQWADAAAAFTAGGYVFERLGLDPVAADTDSDGLTDAMEVNTTLTHPQRADTDGDGLSDGVEVNTHQTSPLKADTDEDGLADRAEIEVHHSNPNLKDSDGDGFDDLFEVNTGFDPALATSTPDAQSILLTAVEFRFNAANGASYRIEASTDLEEWTVIENGVIGAGAVITRFYSIENQPTRYFRARRN